MAALELDHELLTNRKYRRPATADGQSSALVVRRTAIDPTFSLLTVKITDMTSLMSTPLH